MPSKNLLSPLVSAALLFAATLVAPGSARASILLELELFNSPGVTTASPGTNVTLAVFMSPGTEGVSAIDYDLNTTAGLAVAAQNTTFVAPGCGDFFTPCMQPLGPPVLAGTSINDFNLSTPGLGPAGGRYQIGIASWNFAGPDTVSITFNLAYDNRLPGQPISPQVSTTFQIVPEPAVASLIALGLVGLALVGPRRRRGAR